MIESRAFAGGKETVFTSLGTRTLPLAKILNIFMVPLLCTQSSQSSYSAFLTLSGSGEYRSRGQYVGTYTPGCFFLSECFFMQNRQTRDLRGPEVWASKEVLGLNPHFGCNWHNQIRDRKRSAGRTLISTAHPLLPIKSVANTALVRLRSIASFSRLFAGRFSS